MLNLTERGALFRHFCVSKVITTVHAHKNGAIFHFFQELSNKQKKIKALQPKMTKIASRGSCLKSLPKFQLRVGGCSCLFKIVWIPLTLPKFSLYRNGEFSLYRKLHATEIEVDYSTQEVRLSLRMHVRTRTQFKSFFSVYRWTAEVNKAVLGYHKKQNTLGGCTRERIIARVIDSRW